MNFKSVSTVTCFFLFQYLNSEPNQNLVRTLEVTNTLPDQQQKQVIPKIFHTIWINFGRGDDVFPKYTKNMHSLQEMHPDWELKLWREPEITQIIRKHYSTFLKTFTSYNMPIKKHDAARIVLLHHFGGVYLDQDFIPIRNLDPLFKSYIFVAGNEEQNKIQPVNGLMGSIKGLELLELYINKMNAPDVSQAYVLEATGPFLLKKILLEYCNKHGNQGIKIYSHEFFYPIHWSNKNIVNSLKTNEIPDKFPNSYLMQEYDASWR